VLLIIGRAPLAANGVLLLVNFPRAGTAKPTARDNQVQPSTLDFASDTSTHFTER